MTRTSRKQLVLVEKMADGRVLIEQETHAGLWLDRYIQSPDREEIKSREKLFEEVVKLPLSETYRVFYAHWEEAVKAFSGGGELHYAEAKGRLIVGMGDESVLETSIALHHTYGVPYLPGSALKGLAASYAHQQLQGEWKKGGEWHKIVFGNTEEAGFITFFDALYVPPTDGKKKEAVLYRDVITVHHPDYYRGKQENAEPADWDSPTPITFLSTGGKYLLALAAPDLEEKKIWLQATFQIVEMALANVGIGGKTSSGYGRMVVKPSAFVVEEGTVSDHQQTTPQNVPTIDPETRTAQSIIADVSRLQSRDLPSRIDHYYRKWNELQLPETRRVVAEAIIERIRATGHEKKLATKDWYQELKASRGEQKQ